MPITIQDPEIERLAKALASATGEPVDHALATALRERLSRVTLAGSDSAPATGTPPFRSVAEIRAYLAARPDLDPRTPDEILGYDGDGLPRPRATEPRS